ncbi:oxidoreductase/dehydrogenase [Mycolicibacterium madagascariense]|uniref:enoyl-[acyl-carrier-protein] reductase n=1 Tax=Mycolicibacterium madagascariense TaxID=212765 RepID=A0A7I7XBY8_9MYCO|nr:zinc-dependent alcohol dehydrogenase family protein [Mycolicibacterium madagascariense]MCV7013393.1 zinc-dependent alcohol dehydrogenase family protein [Mycolicibacterium madagascariense]BBZ25888.1 oxidoreductase/dehydrogenase [Mycolicibacterium madagascariense]
MQSIQFSAFGDPSSVTLVDEPPRAITSAEVRIAVEAAPLNPSDFLLLDGRYGIRPELPSPLGAEGVGVVLEVGDGVTRAAVGQRVLILPSHTLGTWQDEIVVDERYVVAVHRDADPLQLATVPINAATAYLLVDFAASSPAGSWILQTAANSGLGAFVRVLAARAGLRLVDVVRSDGAAQALRATGAQYVVVANDTLGVQLDGVLGDEQLSLALDGVGGPIIDGLLPHLANDGQIVSFGSLSGQPVVVPGRVLNFKGLHVHGFWLHNWLSSAPAEEIDRVYTELVDLVADGVLTTPVEAAYPLSDHTAAIDRARTYGRSGKVLFAAAGDGTIR